VRLQEIAVGVESVPTASPDEPLSDLVERMRGTAGQALVLDGDRPVGTVTLADILRAARLMGPTAWRRPAPGAPGPVGQPRA
jgi:predicted transcriptional regulator